MNQFILFTLVAVAILPQMASAQPGKVYIESASQGTNLKFESSTKDITWKAVYTFVDDKNECENRILVLPGQGSYSIQTQTWCKLPRSIVAYFKGVEREQVGLTGG